MIVIFELTGCVSSINDLKSQSEKSTRLRWNLTYIYFPSLWRTMCTNCSNEASLLEKILKWASSTLIPWFKIIKIINQNVLLLIINFLCIQVFHLFNFLPVQIIKNVSWIDILYICSNAWNLIWAWLNAWTSKGTFNGRNVL